MNKRVLLSLLALLSFSAVMAQDYVRPVTEDVPSNPQNKKFLISVSLGVAIPEGDFASTNVKNSFWDFNSSDSTRLQGFAKTGFHFDISATYMIQNDFGIMVQFSSNTNSFDLNAFSATMGFPAFAQTIVYHTKEYLIGPYFAFSAANKLKFTASALFGFVSNNYPTITLQLNDTLNYTRNIDDGKNVLGYCINVGLAYSLSDNIDLLLNIGYTGATLKYPDWTETYQLLSSHPTVYYYLPVTYLHSNDETSMKTGILKPTLGVVFRL